MKRPRATRRFLSEQEHSLARAGALAFDIPRKSPCLLPLAIGVLAGMTATCGVSCHQAGDSKDLPDGKKPMTADSQEFAAINQVLEAHADELMAIQGVAGVAIGLLEDGETPCLKILVVKLTRELESELPGSLDGHPVVVEESGVIRPLDDK
jgi:hypothetical protein